MLEKMKISVALCTYNGEKFLEKQLDSILNQSVPVTEIVVCDDISSDSTKSILEKYDSNNPGIFRLYFNEENLRSNKNFEKAIGLTTGDYIFLADQDDIWVKDKVKKTIAVFDENPTAEGVFSDATLVDDNDDILFDDISLWDSVYFFEKLMKKPIDLYKLLICKGNYLTGATLCIKKTVKDFCFPFKTIEKTFLHDEWFAFILSERKTLFYSTEKLISYRIHSGQQMGVGNIKKNAEAVSGKMPRSLEITLGIYQPKTFKDYKNLTRILFSQYEKYKELNTNKNFYTEKIEDEMLRLYLVADAGMKKSNPAMYYLRKKKDKKKGKRQL